MAVVQLLQILELLCWPVHRYVLQIQSGSLLFVYLSSLEDTCSLVMLDLIFLFIWWPEYNF